jgi:hypothetical protein
MEGERAVKEERKKEQWMGGFKGPDSDRTHTEEKPCKLTASPSVRVSTRSWLVARGGYRTVALLTLVHTVLVTFYLRLKVFVIDRIVQATGGPGPASVRMCYGAPLGAEVARSPSSMHMLWPFSPFFFSQTTLVNNVLLHKRSNAEISVLKPLGGGVDH